MCGCCCGYGGLLPIRVYPKLLFHLFPQDMTSNPRQALKFTVKETVCPVSEKLPGTECDFRDDGVSHNRL